MTNQKTGKTYEQESYANESGMQRVLREVGDCYQAYGLTAGMITEELGYVFDLEQYPGQDLGRGSDDPDRIQPIDLLLPNQWRYNVDKIEESAPIHISCKPNQRTDLDPMLAAEKTAQMRRALEWLLLYNPLNNFADVRSRYIGGAQAGRLWLARWDFVPYLGEHGEIIPRLVDPRNVMLPRGFLTPHDPLCPAMHEIVRMPFNEARRMQGWDVKGLKADAGDFSIANVIRNATHDTSEGPFRAFTSRGSDSRDAGEGWCTFIMTHRKFEPETKKLQVRVELPDDERTMSCPACGYRTPPQVMVAATAQQHGMEFDGFKESEDGCPQCVTGALQRQDFRLKTPQETAATRGKRLEFYCLNGSLEDRAAYQGPWQCPGARTFPYLWLPAYLFPHRAIPESNVSWGWPVSAARNFTNRVLFEQVHRSRPFTILPDDGLEDKNGQRFDLGEDADDVAFATRDFPPEHLQVVQAQAPSEAMFKLSEMLAAQFHGTEGNDQISIPPERSRDIAAASLQLQSDSGNVPINGFVRRLYNAESIWFGVLSDYVRHFWRVPRDIRKEEPMAAMPQPGIVWESVYGPELPNVDVVVGAGADLSQLRQETVAAYQNLMLMPRPLRRAIGQASGVDAYTLDMMDQVEMAETPLVPPGASAGAGTQPAPSRAASRPGSTPPTNPAPQGAQPPRITNGRAA